MDIHQFSRLVAAKQRQIDRPELTDRYILRNIQARIKEGQDIIELWLIDKGEVKLLYKKTEE